MERLLHIFIFALASLIHPGRPFLATNKLSLASWGSYNYREHKGPGTYAYGYDIEDPVTGNIQFRQEERHSNGTITGSYGYVDADGVPRVTHYVSDINGYRILMGKPPVPSAEQGNKEPARPSPHLPNDQIFAANFLSGNPKSDKIHNPTPLIYEFHGNAPFLDYYKKALPPFFAYRRK